jgi:septum formation protein
MRTTATSSHRPAPRFILASASPRRRDLLASLGIVFTVSPANIDETQRPGEPPLAYVQRLSAEKAAAVARAAAPPALILAADTVVICDGAILGKPADADEARHMLRTLRGRAHIVCTALTLTRLEADAAAHTITRATSTDVHMRAYTDADIEAYIATGDPFDKAGGYAIQHAGFAPVADISGSYTNVVGLPLETLRALLAEQGWPLPSDN